MDFNGIVLFEIASKGSLVDLRFDFLVEQGKTNLALYSFDNELQPGSDQAFADAAVRARMQRKKPKMKINIIGERASNPLSQRMTDDFNKLASSKGDKAIAKFPNSCRRPRVQVARGPSRSLWKVRSARPAKSCWRCRLTETLIHWPGNPSMGNWRYSHTRRKKTQISRSSSTTFSTSSPRVGTARLQSRS